MKCPAVQIAGCSCPEDGGWSPTVVQRMGAGVHCCRKVVGWSPLLSRGWGLESTVVEKMGVGINCCREDGGWNRLLSRRWGLESTVVERMGVGINCCREDGGWNQLLSRGWGLDSTSWLLPFQNMDNSVQAILCMSFGRDT